MYAKVTTKTKNANVPEYQKGFKKVKIPTSERKIITMNKKIIIIEYRVQTYQSY